MTNRGGSDGREGRTRRMEDRAVYIISVAAELAGVHPQTLRIYERKGLLSPARTPGNTRRYSQRDIARLQMIQRLTQDFGINLAGVKMIVEMENELHQMRRRIERMERELSAARRRMQEEIERARGRPAGADMVPVSSIRRLLAELGFPNRVVDRKPAGGRGTGKPIPVGPAGS
jgi:MerR family transcriptional regulator, heat shock protein HspR